MLNKKPTYIYLPRMGIKLRKHRQTTQLLYYEGGLYITISINVFLINFFAVFNITKGFRVPKKRHRNLFCLLNNLFIYSYYIMYNLLKIKHFNGYHL